MQKHVKVYLDYFDLGEQDIITCEATGKQGRVDGQGFDIHHINGRGPGKDVIENLMCLQRKIHDKANTGELPKEELQLIHNNFLQGNRIKFIK